MAEAIVSFGLNKLLELLSHESELLNGIDVQVDELKRQLRGLQSLSKDADTKKHGSERVRNFLEDVKEIVYDAEDVIESFLLKGNTKGFNNHVRRLAFFLMDRRKFASDIKCIIKRISWVVSGMQSLGIQQIIDGGCSLSLQETQREIRQTFGNNSESDLVGMEQSVEELLVHLVDNNDNIGLVSISGMGGIGKTTLARQVFHHDTIRRHFDGFVWVCISQQFTQRRIWQRIFKELRPHEEETLRMDEYTLQSKLFLLFETGKYLVVLDDIWREDDWDRIKAVFPRKTGCKILLTSRNEGVGLHADPTCIALKPRTLTLEESWKLCKRIITSTREETEFRVDEELQALGKKMITYCGGLPLAVKLLGGLLVKKHTFPEWRRVYDTIGKSGLDNNNLNSVYQVLSLSYEDLPMHLKHCFLYLAHFPEDYKIDVETLFHYWASEGIITSCFNLATIRDSGEEYLDELVRRNMVTIDGRGYMFSRNKYCQMHDMMREVCLSKAKEENFLQIIKVPTIDAQSPSRSRRLALHDGNAFHMLGIKSNRKVRSLLGFVEKEFWKHSTAHGFRSLPLLRVLDLSYVHFEGRKIPSTIGELVHLRFLSLYNAGVTYLPSSLRNLKLLLHLNLCVIGESVHVPNVLKEMVKLRYLSLPYSMHDDTKLELGNLVNLETLRYFSTKHSNVMDLLYMTKLTELYLYFGDGYTSETLCSSLEVLSLHELRENQVASHKGELVQLKDFVQLKEIKLNIHIPRFPHQYQFPPHLTHISLVNCNMEEDPMPVLEKLLHLKSVYFTYDVIVGKRIVCSKGGFPQLCALRLHLQTKLEEWIIEEGSMPCLHTLTLNECRKLKELSNGLRYITSLKELAIVRMKKDWREKLVPSGEDYYKVQHIPSVQFTNCDE